MSESERLVKYKAAAKEFFALGTAFYGLGLIDPALENLNNGLKLQPNSIEMLCFRGIILEKLGRDTDALKDYNKALQLKANRPIATIHCRKIF